MILNTLKFLFILLEVVVLFNLLIVVHELGHFLAAKWRGLVVEKFGIWFGKPLWKKTIGGVEYSLGSIPAGGFVALPQMAPMEALEGAGTSDRAQLPKISALDKIIVAVAGPLFSFLLAIFFAVIVWIVGRPAGEAETTTTVGYVEEGSPAAAAGIKPGDVIQKVDGHAVSRFSGMASDSVTWRIVRSEGDTIPIELRRGEEIITANPAPILPQSDSWYKRKTLKQIRIHPKSEPMVAKVLPGSPAQKDGYLPNDIVVKVNREPVLHYFGFNDWLMQHPGEKVTLTVERNGANMDLPYTRAGAVAGKILPDSPAARAGLLPGDVFVSVDGKPIDSAGDFSKYVRGSKGAVSLVYRRGSEEKTSSITPLTPEGETTPMIGIAWQGDGIEWDRTGRVDIVHPGPIEQVSDSVAMIVNTISALFAPKTGVSAQHMSGPLMIFRIYYMMFEGDQGWRMALWFSVVLNVNLAILNLLPFPVLDGGHISIALVEAVRRKPINVRLLEFVQTACAMLLIGYMLYVSFWDAGDIFGSDKLKFPKAPPPAETPAQP